MTPLLEAQHLNRRRLQSIKIVVQADRYKVCDQCNSIVGKNSPACHICGAYRFLYSAEAVRLIANYLGTTPFPVTSAVVPRISESNVKLDTNSHSNN